MNDGDIQDMQKVHFALLLLLIFRKCSCVIVEFFWDGLGTFGVGIASSASERVLVLFECYEYIQKMLKF